MQYHNNNVRRKFAPTLLALIFTLTLTALIAPNALAQSSSRTVGNDREPQAGDQKPASVLVFNLFASSAANSAQEDTQVAITNTNLRESAIVHLFVIDGTSCATADTYLCLTPTQTASFQASEIDPGTRGYIVAIASNAEFGCPIGFNYLVGSEKVKLASGHSAKLNAVGFAAHFSGAVRGCKRSDAIATIELDGRDYDAVPRRLALDSIPSTADGNSTLLVVNSLSGSLLTGMTKLTQIFGVLYDDSENAFSFTGPANCQLFRSLTNDFPRTTPLFSTVIPSRRSGWLFVMTARNDLGITGASINLNPQAGSLAGAFNGGSNLHHLETTSASMAVPVFPPAC